MNIINPIFSFVQFASGSNPEDCLVSLPVAESGDVVFQFMTDETATDAKLYIVKTDAIITDDSSLAVNGLLSGFSIPILNENLLLAFGLPDITDLADGMCFRLCIKIDGSFFISNCFVKNSDIRYSSLLQYSCNEDAYDFSYCSGPANSIRVAAFITRPQFKDDETFYVKSDGSRVVLKSVTSKIFEGKTDRLAAEVHERIKVALSHDNVYIESYHYSGGISKDGDYSIEWIDFMDEELAPATFSVYVTPYLATNNNCGECDVPCVSIADISGSVSGGCVPASIVGAPDLPDVTVGEPYNYEISLQGELPFDLTDITKPDWMAVDIDESTIVFSGTPTEAEDDVAVSFNINNCAADPLPFSDTFDIQVSTTRWGSPSFDFGDEFADYESLQIIGGVPGAVVTVTVSDYVNPNGGTLKVNSTLVTAIGQTFNFTLGGLGKSAGISMRIDCINNPATAILGKFTITSVSEGGIGTPSDFIISKVF